MKILKLLRNKFVVLGIVFTVALIGYFVMIAGRGVKGGPVYIPA